MKNKLALIPFFAALQLILAGCGHDIQSPVPRGNAIEPDLVCNALPASAPFSTVVIEGDHFTPMPSKTLLDKPELILPKITLTQTQPLPGDAKLDKPVDIIDDPAKPEASRVHWFSEQKMSFDVKPEDTIPTGVFTIKITNPDGKSAATISSNIAVIPAPVIGDVQPPAICDDQSDQVLTITGTSFLVYEGKSPTVTVGSPPNEKTYTATVDPKSCTPLEGNFAEMNVMLCTSMTITIKQGDFPVTEPTKVKVVVTNPPPADCASLTSVKEITIQPPPRVDSVLPATVCEGGSQLTINGKNFLPGATVRLDCGGTSVDAAAATVNTDGTQISATFGAGATPGMQCDLIVTNPDGCEDRPLPHQKVTVTTGPILFYVDPPVVYNGINTRVTLFATSITTAPPPAQPLPDDAVTMTPSGMTMPVTKLAYNLVAGHVNRLQAIIPVGQPPGSYDITLKDESGCFATLPNAVVVTADLTVTIASVNPPFGDTAEDTAVTIFRDKTAAAPADKPFVETPRVFLNPTNPQPTDVAVEVVSVAFVNADTATGVVPEGTPVHDYDVVLVNPDGSVGVLGGGYREVGTPPPIVLTATPSSIVSATGQIVVLAGKNFDPADVVTLSCVDALGAPVPSPNVTSMAPVCATGCTQSITIDGSALTAGSVCVVRVTNPDGSYGEYSAIGVTNSSLNLSAPKAGPDMTTGRRALVAAAGNATTAARFIYAIGGDTGTPAGALDTTELAPVDLFGKIGAWTTQLSPLTSKRTLAGAATVGRYIYLVGGDDGTNGPIATAERALILSPREAPSIDDVDLALEDVGLDQGEWHYRVSAIFAANDTDNPGGESLASDPFSIKLPAFSKKKIAVTLVWKAPVDSLGVDVAGVAGYRIYRTAAANGAQGTEVLIATLNDPAQFTFKDDGTSVPGTEEPLPTGSTGKWAKLPNMVVNRSGPGVAAVTDPVTPTVFYVYALLGKSAANTVVTSYEFLKVTVAANGRQTADPAWTNGTAPSGTGRWQHGAWVVDKTVQSNYAADTWIFLGGGLNGANNLVGTVDAAKVQAGGQLAAFNDAGVGDFSSNSAGYGVCGANQQLFVFGGQGAAPSKGAKSAALFSNGNPNNQLPPPGLANNAWNSEGLSMTHGRYLMGSAVQSSFIFLLGGQTDEPSAASKTMELVIW